MQSLAVIPGVVDPELGLKLPRTGGLQKPTSAVFPPRHLRHNLPLQYSTMSDSGRPHMMISQLVISIVGTYQVLLLTFLSSGERLETLRGGYASDQLLELVIRTMQIPNDISTI
jgi:hypothetical protein